MAILVLIFWRILLDSNASKVCFSLYVAFTLCLIRSATCTFFSSTPRKSARFFLYWVRSTSSFAAVTAKRSAFFFGGSAFCASVRGTPSSVDHRRDDRGGVRSLGNPAAVGEAPSIGVSASARGSIFVSSAHMPVFAISTNFSSPTAIRSGRPRP